MSYCGQPAANETDIRRSDHALRQCQGPSSVTTEHNEKLIAGVTDVLVKVLNENPECTFVLIDEVAPENWGIAGVSTLVYRQRSKDSPGGRK